MTKDLVVSDEVLAQQAIQDLSCFETLIERYEGKLKCYVLRLTNITVHEAEDILQEIFLKVWKNLNGFNPSLKFSSWIYRIAHNETISFARSQKSRGIDKQAGIDDAVFEIKSQDLEIGDQFDQSLDSQSVRSTLALLPNKYKDILVLRFLEDKSYEEISDILKKPMGTVATMINRAKKAFQEIYLRQNKT
ncbi:MAG TPA: RNA polymerase sigma factor [Candidatus Gracilibacteria bacterium]